jgi:chromosome segregation ATPase
MPLFKKKREEKEEEKEEEIKVEEGGEDDAGRIGLSSEERYEEEVKRMEELEAEREEAAPEMGELLLKIEKIHGRLEALDEAKARMDERIMRISEQVGELRTMGIEREKTIGMLEADFELIKGVFEEVKPSEFSKELQRKEKSITEVRVKIEKLEHLLEKLGDEVRGFRELMEKVKGLENLVEMQRLLKAEAAKGEETKKYIDRIAAKVESIFAELSSRLLTLDEYQGKVETVDELTKELVRGVDELGVKLKDCVTAEELEDVIKKEDLRSFSKGIEEKITGMEKNIKEFQDALKEEFKSIEKRGEELDRRMRGIEIPYKELWGAIDGIRELVKLLTEEKSLSDLVKERERLSKEKDKDKDKLRIVESRIDEIGRLGRLARIVEELEEKVKKLAGVSLIDERTLEELRERIKKEDIQEVRRVLEERIKKVEIPEEVRKSIEREISREVKEAFRDEVERLRSLLDRKMERFDRLKLAVKEGVESIPAEVDKNLGRIHSSLDELRSQVSELRRTQEELLTSSVRYSSSLEDLEKELSNLRRDFRSLKSMKSLDALSREKESILSSLDTLKVRYDEGIISRESYEKALRENLERIGEIDARIEELSKMDEIKHKIGDTDRNIKELATICKSFVTKDELSDLRERMKRDELAKLRESLEKTIKDASGEMEMKLNQQRVELQKLSDATRRITSEERIREIVHDSSTDTMKKMELLLESRIGRLAREVESQEEEIKEKMEEDQRSLARKTEERISEQERRISELNRLGESLKREMELLERDVAALSRVRRKSLSELMEERERILARLNSGYR